MTRPKLRPGRLCKAMRKTMAAVAEPGTRVPRLYRRWECVNERYVELATEAGLKSRMRENRTYGSVRGDRQAFHIKSTLKGVSSLPTRLIHDGC